VGRTVTAVITVVGTGPGPLELLTREAETALLGAPKIFLRTSGYPIDGWLRGLGKQLISFSRLYTLPWASSKTMYEFMVDVLLKEASLNGEAVYALPGSPVILEETTRLLVLRGREAGIRVRIIHGLSFVEVALASMQTVPGPGLQIVLPRSHVRTGFFDPRLPMLLCQIEARDLPTDTPQVALTMQWLLRTYPADHVVTLISASGPPAFETHCAELALGDLESVYGASRSYSSLYVPPVKGR
jgi:tetrapyrrole methylase family protein/MazG family protein